jgi:hypothetical protein
MADIDQFHWGLADWLVLALVVGAPGIGLGGACGALIWRGRRMVGAGLGALTGLALGAVGFVVWADTQLSLSHSYPQTEQLALLDGAPGLAIGALIGAWRGREARAAGAVAGALAGSALWLAGRFCLGLGL